MNWLQKISAHNFREFSVEEVKSLGARIGIDWSSSPFPPEQLQKGVSVELEHGSHDSETNVIGNDPVKAAKIAWAHLKELPDYYSRLEKMEAGACKSCKHQT
jgi:hypothetical protein